MFESGETGIFEACFYFFPSSSLKTFFITQHCFLQLQSLFSFFFLLFTSVSIFRFLFFFIPVFSILFLFFFLSTLSLFFIFTCCIFFILPHASIVSLLSSFFLHLINFLLLLLFSLYSFIAVCLASIFASSVYVFLSQYEPSSISDSVWNSVIKDRGRFFGVPQLRYYVIGFPPFKGPSDSIDTAESRITRKGFPSRGLADAVARLERSIAGTKHKRMVLVKESLRRRARRTQPQIKRGLIRRLTVEYALTEFVDSG